MPRVTVIVPIYNAGDYLGQCIDSVRTQTFTDWECLLLDDGSTDLVVGEVLETVEDPRIRVHRFATTEAERQASVRYASLINWAADQSRGEHFVFLPGDDYLAYDALERMVATTTDGVVYGPQVLVDARGRTTGYRNALFPLTNAWHQVDISQVMVSQRAFAHVGGWQDSPPSDDLWRCADGHFWNRLTEAGYVFQPVPGGAVSMKRYRAGSVDERVRARLTPW